MLRSKMLRVKQFRKIVWNVAALISAILFVAITLIWMRSFSSKDTLQCEVNHYTRDWHWKYLTFQSNSGELFLAVGYHVTQNMSRPARDGENPEGWHFTREVEPANHDSLWILGEPTTLIDWHGFYCHVEHRGDVDWFENSASVAVPGWSAAIIALLLPLGLLLKKARLKIRDNSQLCRSCGYDLRATPDRCPECGAVPAKKDVI